jgi:dTDP-4-amino-4,6-dideoxygalactose transaminase
VADDDPATAGDEFIMFHRPSLGAEEERAVLEVLRSGWLTTGPRTKSLEKRFAAYRGCRRAVGVNSCTAALHLALVALGVGAGDEVITTPITFASTVNVIIHCGATPVFCDVQADTLNMDPASLEAAITPKTKAVIAVHFAGHPCDMDEIDAIVRPLGIPVVEDAAHSLEAEYKGRPAGSLGVAAGFSFYATKNVTSGEGGMLTTSDDRIAAEAEVLALHGISRDAWKRYADEGYRHWDIVAPGYKYNMFDIQAALVDTQLDRVDAFWERRRRLVERYDEAMVDLPGLYPLRRRDYVKASYHLYVVRVRPESGRTRDQVMTTLQTQGVGVGVHFRAVHLHPYYRETFGFRPGMLPVAESNGETVLSLPLYPSLRDDQFERVVGACRTALEVR